MSEKLHRKHRIVFRTVDLCQEKYREMISVFNGKELNI